ncbi:MAG TPA: Crp/Fnr family transcriptional regulator [Tissierellaceae bacterium]|nr:Crp/Fnr family transcriptional regulator [Tissierellaceae bacterium]
MIEVAKITTERTYKKGQMIYMAGDRGEKLYVIHLGRVKINRFTESGKEQVIRVLGPGEFMGELSLFSPANMTDNAEVLEDTTMCVIDGNNLKELMKQYPDISFKIIEEISKRLETAEELIENISLSSVEKRLSQTLLNMAGEGKEINLKMRKGDLASQIGMSQETLSRKLSAFQELGIIELVGHRKIIIKDKGSLEDIE